MLPALRLGSDRVGPGRHDAMRRARRRAHATALIPVQLACLVITAAVCTALADDGDAAASGRASGSSGDVLVAADADVHQIYALGGTVVYPLAARDSVGTDERWIRIIGGRRLAIRGLPRHAVVIAIGRDRRGRV